MGCKSSEMEISWKFCEMETSVRKDDAHMHLLMVDFNAWFWPSERTLQGQGSPGYKITLPACVSGVQTKSHNYSLYNLDNLRLHPWRLTWNIIMEVWKIIFLSKRVICRCHANLPGCNQQKLWPMDCLLTLLVPENSCRSGTKNKRSMRHTKLESSFLPPRAWTDCCSQMGQENVGKYWKIL